MFRRLFILFFQPVYPVHKPECGDVPDYLTLREIADLPAYHPSCGGSVGKSSTRR